MGMFGDQLQRLLRTKWKNPWSLAQEIYSMLGSIDGAVTSTTPTEVSPSNPNSGPVTIYDDWGPLQPISSIRRPDGSVISLTPSGFTDNGGLIPGMEFPPMGVTLPDWPSPQSAKTSSPPQQGGGNAGTIVSGSGSSYQVQLVSGETVSAIQGQIDPGETIPAGTFALLAKVDGKYYMQVPVWLGDPV